MVFELLSSENWCFVRPVTVAPLAWLNSNGYRIVGVVPVDVVTTEGEKNVLANLQHKARAAERMFGELVRHMNEAIGIDRAALQFDLKEELPQWL